MRHSLGLNDKGHGRSYRNHFCTGPGSKDYDDCEAMVVAGYMKLVRGPHPLSGGDNTYAVTTEGVAVVERFKEPEAVLTRPQQRYRDWLKSGSDAPFYEWLKNRSYVHCGAPPPANDWIAGDFLGRAANTGSNDEEIKLLQGAVRELLDMMPRNRIAAAKGKLDELLGNKAKTNQG